MRDNLNRASSGKLHNRPKITTRFSSSRNGFSTCHPFGRMHIRLMTMIPRYPCGKPCSTGTHDETAISSSIESKILSYLFAITIVIHKSRNLIGTLGSSEFGPKWGHVFRVILCVSVDHSALIKSKSIRKQGPPGHKSRRV